ncbi:MAG: MFS transporter, partial [Candidatus Eremiobacteraeota bacterium]|nr:MFS transporter [Candidatus Eremiobacteraeota bacterium]
SYFELTLLTGLALGGIIAAQLFGTMQAGAFLVVAVVYLTCAAILFLSVEGTSGRNITHPIADLKNVLRLPSIARLAPVWLCVNAVIGLWLGPTLPFLLTQRAPNGQYLAGLFTAEPARVGWLLFGYALVFGAGVTAWSFVLPHVRLRVALWISLGAMLPACAGIYLLNHSAQQADAVRWTIGGFMALVIMIESGFTPAALAWLAGSLPQQSGRGAVMGVYSVLLSIGAIAGSLLAAVLGQLYSIDGLLYGTVLAAALAVIFLRWVPDPRPHSLEQNA